MDEAVKEVIVELLGCLTVSIDTDKFLKAMETKGKVNESISQNDYAVIKNSILKKSQFQDKFIQLKKMDIELYRLFAKTCADFLKKAADLDQNEIRKVVDVETKKPNSLSSHRYNDNENTSPTDFTLSALSMATNMSKKEKNMLTYENILAKLNSIDNWSEFEKLPGLGGQQMTFSLADFSFFEQEQKVISDLITLLTGLDGDYIYRKADQIGQFEFHEGIDTSFMQIIHAILPLVSNYDKIDRFAKKQLLFKQGTVNNALGQALLNNLRVERILINDIGRDQLTGNFNIHYLWKKLTHLVDSARCFEQIVYDLVRENAFGGKTLSVLYRRIKSNNRNERHFDSILNLLIKTSEPYFEMLNSWLQFGTFFDPLNEFMVIDETSLSKSSAINFIDYGNCENRYTLRDMDQVPVFLHEKSTLILKTGKNRTILQKLQQKESKVNKGDSSSREGGGSGGSGESNFKPLEMNMLHNYYNLAVTDIFEKSCSDLKNYINVESDFHDRLKAMKRFMLMEQGDFVHHVMRACEPNLSRPFSETAIFKIKNSFNSVKKLFLHYRPLDIFVKDINVEFLPYDLNYELTKIINSKTNEKDSLISYQQMTGFDYFSFTVNVQWPFSIVFSPAIMNKYKLLFRHLFYYKSVEYSLCGVWQLGKSSWRNAKHDFNCHLYYLRSISAIRSRMLSTIQILEYFIMKEVIEKNFKDFLQKLDSSLLSTDHILEYHERFLTNCLIESMVIDDNIQKTMSQILRISATFCRFAKEVHEATAAQLQQLSFTYFPDTEYSVQQTIDRFEFEYSRLIIYLFDSLRKTNDDKLISLITRIDLNLFYELENELSFPK